MPYQFYDHCSRIRISTQHLSGYNFPPGDLYSDEPPVEKELHLGQIMFLIKRIKWLWKDRYDFYPAGNLTIYYSPNKKKSEHF